MGEINKISCHSCGKEWEYKSGCGIMHARLEAIADFFEPHVAEEFMVYANAKPPVLFDFALMPAKCEICRSIVEIPVLKIEHTQYVGKCAGCASEAKLITDMDKTECPRCHHKEWKCSVIGSWD